MVDKNKLNIYMINSVIILLVSIFNLFKGLIHKEGIIYFLLYVAVFIPVLGFNEYSRRKNNYRWNAILYAFLGLATILGNEAGNYSGAAFILFSVYIFNTSRTNIILSILTAIMIVAKNIFFGFEITNTMNLFLDLHYLLYFNPSEKSKDFY